MTSTPTPDAEEALARELQPVYDNSWSGITAPERVGNAWRDLARWILERYQAKADCPGCQGHSASCVASWNDTHAEHLAANANLREYMRQRGAPPLDERDADPDALLRHVQQHERTLRVVRDFDPRAESGTEAGRFRLADGERCERCGFKQRKGRCQCEPDPLAELDRRVNVVVELMETRWPKLVERSELMEVQACVNRTLGRVDKLEDLDAFLRPMVPLLVDRADRIDAALAKHEAAIAELVATVKS